MSDSLPCSGLRPYEGEGVGDGGENGGMEGWGAEVE